MSTKYGDTTEKVFVFIFGLRKLNKLIIFQLFKKRCSQCTSKRKIWYFFLTRKGDNSKNNRVNFTKFLSFILDTSYVY